MSNASEYNPSLTAIHFDPSGGTNPSEYLWFDAVLSEEHSISTLVMSHPTEEGFPITDHVREQPDSISINGFVSNSHFGAIPQPTGGSRITDEEINVNPTNNPNLPDTLTVKSVSSGSGFSQRSFDRVKVVFDTLKIMSVAGWLVDILTEQRSYKNMIVDNVTWSPDSGGGGTFAIEASHVRVVSTEVRTVETARLSDRHNRRRGGTSTRQPSAAQTEKSLQVKRDALGISAPPNTTSDIGATSAG